MWPNGEKTSVNTNVKLFPYETFLSVDLIPVQGRGKPKSFAMRLTTGTDRGTLMIKHWTSSHALSHPPHATRSLPPSHPLTLPFSSTSHPLTLSPSHPLTLPLSPHPLILSSSQPPILPSSLPTHHSPQGTALYGRRQTRRNVVPGSSPSARQAGGTLGENTLYINGIVI